MFEIGKNRRVADGGSLEIRVNHFAIMDSILNLK
jgi:hypothetical protein